MKNTDTREAWLERAVNELRPFFSGVNFPVPERVRVTCGFPSVRALSTKRPVIGQCWDAKASADLANEVMISPRLHDPMVVLETLVHELGHAAVGLECGHKGAFRKMMKAIGLEGKPTATVAGERLRASLVDVVGVLGPYPHAKFDPRVGHKKQTTRLIKCECSECGYTVRTTAKWLEVGAPHCPDHGEMDVCS